jgi:hypothetical protein
MDKEIEIIEAREKRHSFSLKFKIDILQEYEAGVKGKGFYALAKKYNTSASTIRGWHDKKDKIFKSLLDPDISVKVARRVKGGGRKHHHEELEIMLIAWVKDRNSRGLRVKDKYIQMKARELCNQLRASIPDDDQSVFKASTGWLAKFKKRNHFVLTTNNITHTSK